MSENDAHDSVIIDSIAQLTQQLLSIDNGSGDTTKLDVNALNEEYFDFKVKTKDLLKHLFAKLEENAHHEKELGLVIDDLRRDNQAKDAKLGKLTKYVESFIEKCTLDADERCATLSNELESITQEKYLVEKMVLKLTSENRKLQDEVRLLRIAESGTTNSQSSKAHMTDMICENEELKDNIGRLEEELKGLRLQRDAEMLSVMQVVREFETIIRNKQP